MGWKRGTNRRFSALIRKNIFSAYLRFVKKSTIIYVGKCVIQYQWKNSIPVSGYIYWNLINKQISQN